MKKKLNVESIQSELRGGSAFFPGYKSPDALSSRPEKVRQADAVEKPAQANTPIERPQTSADTMIPRHHDTMVSRNHDTITPTPDTDIFEVVRKAGVCA